MRVCAERHGRAGDHDKSRCHVADVIRRGIKKREERGDGDHDDTEDHAAENSESAHLVCLFLRVLEIAAAEDVADDDTDGFTHRDERYTHEVPDGGLDVDRSDRVEASVGIALVDHSHAKCPECLVTHERECFYKELAGKIGRDLETGEGALDEGELVRVFSGVDDKDTELDETGDDRSDCGTDCAECRKTEHTVDQKSVSDEIDDDRAKRSDHRDFCLAQILKGPGISLCQTDRDQSDEHDLDVIDTDVQDLRCIRGVTFAVQEELDEERSSQCEGKDAQRGKDRVEDDLEAEGIADALRIAFTVILRSKDTHAGGRAEGEKIEYEDQLVSNSHAGDRIRAQVADHEVVQKVDEIADTVLDHHRDRDQKELLIYLFVFF